MERMKTKEQVDADGRASYSSARAQREWHAQAGHACL